jgi:hypothetical protein
MIRLKLDSTLTLHRLEEATILAPDILAHSSKVTTIMTNTQEAVGAKESTMISMMSVVGKSISKVGLDWESNWVCHSVHSMIADQWLTDLRCHHRRMTAINPGS